MNPIKELVKKQGAVLVDVRSPWEYETEHLAGALNIPLEELPYKISEIRAFTEPVVLYCRSGSRSGMAVSILKQHGLVNVYNGGGLQELQTLLN